MTFTAIDLHDAEPLDVWEQRRDGWQPDLRFAPRPPDGDR